MKYIKSLDTLRTFAVLLVIIDHWGYPGGSDMLHTVLQYIVPDGQFGVNLFFVLSGFLITGILLQARDAEDGNKMGMIKNFFFRRAFRIFPIYYLMIGVLLLLHYKGISENLSYYLTYSINVLFYQQGAWGAIPHTWSLAVEEQFYVVWPWIIIFLPRKYFQYLFPATIALGLVGSHITYEEVGRGSYPILLTDCISCFGVGGYYAWCSSSEEGKKAFQKVLRPAFWFCLVLYAYWKAQKGTFWNYTTFAFRTVDAILAIQLIIWVVNARQGWFKKYVLEQPALVFIGKISYGIYLYHYALGPLFDGYKGRFFQKHPHQFQFFNQYWTGYFEKIAFLLLVCTLSYYLIERPIMRLKKYFPY